jgi:3D (Asp-Asp-Asp) domain-containing protein
MTGHPQTFERLKLAEKRLNLRIPVVCVLRTCGTVSAPVAGPASHQRRIAAWTALASAVVLLAPASGGGASPGAGSLRQQNVQIDANRHSAALDLYAIDSRLDRENAELATLRGEATQLRTERASARQALHLARHDTRLAERRLAARLRVLYEQGDVSPMEVLLGARSLDEAVTALDNLDRIATQDKHVLAEVRRARATLLRLNRTIAARQARISRLEASAAASASALTTARAAKTSYLERLANQRRLNETRIAEIESRARDAETRAASFARLPVVEARTPASTPPEAGTRTLTVSATGYALTGVTATGLPVGWGVVAVDPSLIPLGTRLTVPGYGDAVAADIGTGVQGSTVDLWFPSVGQAQGWGRRTITITLH